MKVPFFALRYKTLEEAKKHEVEDIALEKQQRTPCIEIDSEKMTFWEAVEELEKAYENNPILNGSCYYFVVLPDKSCLPADSFLRHE